MNIFKYIILIIPFFSFIGFANDKVETNNIVVKNLNLKISLIETAYEIYLLNDNSEEEYENISSFSHNHYKWLKNTKNNLDKDMLKKLDNIFVNNSSWDYINLLIGIDDNSSIDNIIDYIINTDKLNISNEQKKDFKDFFTYFYNEHFKFYFNKQKFLLTKKQSNLNKIINNSKVDLVKFVENISGEKIDKIYSPIFYYSLNPKSTSYFIKDNDLITTISEYSSSYDIIRICISRYSKDILDRLLFNDKFLMISNKLKNDTDLVDSYNKYSSSYSFEEWCVENLVEGFSKYLDYKYYNMQYDFSNYVYDLKFYNYLKDINFDSLKDNLFETCVKFYSNV